MRKMVSTHLLCLLLIALPLSWAEDVKEGVMKSGNSSAWKQMKSRRLFARQKISTPPQSHATRHMSNAMAPARRCSRLMESCASHLPCCDPCASCRCRLFNTICHCWRMNQVCSKQT